MSVDSSGPTLAELAADLQDSQDTLRLVIDEFADATRQLRRAEMLGAQDLVERERAHVSHWRSLLVEAVRPLLMTLDALDVEVSLTGSAQRTKTPARWPG